LQVIGINCIINLEERGEPSVCADMLTCKLLKASFYNFPMSEFTRPKPELLRKIAVFIQGMLLYPDKKIYVHCKHGEDRTGFSIAAFRIIEQKWPLAMAYQECLDMGHKAWFYDSFPFFWKRSLKELS